MDANSDTTGEPLGFALGLVQVQASWLASLLDEAAAALARDTAERGEASRDWAHSATRVALAWRNLAETLGHDAELGERLSGWLAQLGLVAALARRLDWAGIAGRAQALAEEVLGQHGLGPRAAQLAGSAFVLPRSDPRFADPAWREQPAFALLHQLYLLLAEELAASLLAMDDVPENDRVAMQASALRLIVLADPSAHAPLRPGFWGQALATRGASVADDFERTITDMLHCTKTA